MVRICTEDVLSSSKLPLSTLPPFPLYDQIIFSFLDYLEVFQSYYAWKIAVSIYFLENRTLERTTIFIVLFLDGCFCTFKIITTVNKRWPCVFHIALKIVPWTLVLKRCLDPVWRI